jgi:hypothetical protein
VQRLIAQSLSLGIGKRELMCDYYPDELGQIIREHNVLHAPARGESRRGKTITDVAIDEVDGLEVERYG